MNNNPSIKRFDLPIVVAADDIDQNGHVNNIVYMRWVQEVAVAHWNSAATEEQKNVLVWVVVRHEIDYTSSAKLGDEVVARTWVGTAVKTTFERHTEIVRASDNKLLARARTLWCPVNKTTGRVTRVGDDVRRMFSAPG